MFISCIFYVIIVLLVLMNIITTSRIKASPTSYSQCVDLCMMSHVLFFLMLATFTTAMTEITREELVDNACELKANVTLQEHFKESVRKRLSISNGKIGR